MESNLELLEQFIRNMMYCECKIPMSTYITMIDLIQEIKEELGYGKN